MFDRRTVFALIPCLAFAGCASVPMASQQDDFRAKNAQPAPGYALVYLYRHESFGSAVKLGVTVNGRIMGQTAAKTFFLWQLPPGMYQVVSLGENQSALPLTVEPNRVYYVWQEVKMGAFSAGSQLHLVDPNKGRSDVAACSLAVGL